VSAGRRHDLDAVRPDASCRVPLVFGPGQASRSEPSLSNLPSDVRRIEFVFIPSWPTISRAAFSIPYGVEFGLSAVTSGAWLSVA